jgi:hypothetical protein
VGSVETIHRFLLAYTFASGKCAGMRKFDQKRLLDVCGALLAVQAANRLAQTGVLRRYSESCLGPQPTLKDIRRQKTQKFREMKKRRGEDPDPDPDPNRGMRAQSVRRVPVRSASDYSRWFLNYDPAEKKK